MKLSQKMIKFNWTIKEVNNNDEMLGIRDLEIVTHDDTQFQFYITKEGKHKWYDVIEGKDIHQKKIEEKLESEKNAVGTFKSLCTDIIVCTSRKGVSCEEQGLYHPHNGIIYGVCGDVYDINIMFDNFLIVNIRFCLSLSEIFEMLDSFYLTHLQYKKKVEKLAKTSEFQKDLRKQLRL